jgi:hypothetical protein
MATIVFLQAVAAELKENISVGIPVLGQRRISSPRHIGAWLMSRNMEVGK